MRTITIAALMLSLAGCGEAPTQSSSPANSVDDQTIDTSNSTDLVTTSPISLSEILAAQPAEVQARYAHRHPLETLEFVGITPDMTVLEALPGGGWYSKLLLPFLGKNGLLIGADYPIALWPNFPFADDEFMAKKTTWTTDWTNDAQAWRSAEDASVTAAVFGEVPTDLSGSADAVLFIRALHNLARFSDPTDPDNFLQQTLADAFNVLKPGGIVGVVQHEAADSAPDDWANGSAGYLKKSFVIAQMELAGFEYVASSDINHNARDNPSTDDFVWRLPPSFATSQNDDEAKAAMTAIGESNRMTLKFVKPAA